MNSTTTHASTTSSVTQQERSSFRVIFAVAFTAFLAIALVAQVLGWSWRSWLPGAEGAKSVTGGVKAAVYTFMSHLQ